VGAHPGCAQGQGQGQRSRDRALLCWHENRFFSQANGSIATKLAHDDLQGGRMHNSVVTATSNLKLIYDGVVFASVCLTPS